MKIVISGFYGLGNIGDEAILDSMITNLRDTLDEPEITVFSLSPEETAHNHKVKSIYRGWRQDFWKKVKALKEADLLLSGGGGLLQDTYPTRFIFGPLPYYLLIVLLAKLCGCKVMFFSQGIGPVTTDYGKWLMKRFANLADFITVRDTYSKNYLERLQVTKPDTEVTADIAFAYPDHVNDDSCYESLSLIGTESLIGVSVRPWFKEDTYKKEMALLLDRLIIEKKVTPVFIPMEGNHDYAVSEEIISLMDNGTACKILGTNFQPNQYLQFIKHCDLVIGMRLHSIIFSIVAGVPFYALSYDQKVENAAGLAEMTFYTDTLEHFNASDAYFLVSDLYSKYDTVKHSLNEKRITLREQALNNLTLLKKHFVD